jgi:hypothetical protein
MFGGKEILDRFTAARRSDMDERRKHFRFQSAGVVADISQGNVRRYLPVNNFSSGGLDLRGTLAGLGPAVSVELCSSEDTARKIVPLRGAKIVSTGGAGKTRLKFDEELDLGLLEGLLESSRLRAEKTVSRDVTQVNDEICHIQSCRSNIFARTITCLAAAAIGLGALAFAHALERPSIALGGGIAFGLFVVGIFATVEKARAINMRKGYLAALSDLRVRGELPGDYAGWSQMRLVMSECGTRRKISGCARNIGHVSAKGIMGVEGWVSSKDNVLALPRIFFPA